MAGQTGIPAADLRSGALLVGRYRLERLRGVAARSEVWRALDEVLARPVALRLVPVSVRGGKLPAERMIRAAVSRAGVVVDRRFVKVLDFDTAVGAAGRVCLIVSEWVEEPPLSQVLRDERLSPAQATDIAWQLADALAVAAGQGAGHGRIHPGNLALSPDGEVRIADLETGRAIAQDSWSPEELASRDVRGIGNVLYAALSGYWPDASCPVLPPAPSRRGRRRAGQLRGGISRPLDDLTERLLTGGIPDPTRAAALLDGLPRTKRNLTAAPAMAEPQDSPLRKWVARLLPLLVLAVAVLGAYRVGTRLGRVPQAAAARSRAAAAAPSAQPAEPPVALPVAGISVFEPPGHAPEDAAGARLAVDGNPATAWYTFRYFGNPAFGGLKPGAGLLVDLGQARPVSELAVTLVYPGADVELLAGNSASANFADYRLLAAALDAPLRFDMRPAPAVSARYWLVWLTRLPPVAGAYQEGIAELNFLTTKPGAR